MRRMLCLFALVAFVLVTVPAQASIFGPSDEEILAVLQKTFQKDDPQLADFLAMDLATIESPGDAKILAKAMDKALDADRESLDRMLIALEGQGRTVERYFGLLYGKEIHDTLWEQTRPAKQDAYRKALGEYRAILDEVRAQTLVVRKGDGIYEILRRISKEFKEVMP